MRPQTEVRRSKCTSAGRRCDTRAGYYRTDEAAVRLMG
jgi:hypothetical protein